MNSFLFVALVSICSFTRLQAQSAEMPEAPVPALMRSSAPQVSHSGRGDASERVRPRNGDPSKPFLQRVVPAGLGPQLLSPKQKFEMSFRSRIGWQAVASSFLAAGERQLFNNPPHYGTDRGAFGERLGAAETNQAIESFFSYGLYPAAFHDDAHYYILGPGHSFKNRTLYAGSQVFETRSDTGRKVVNWPKLAGLATAAALTNAYYPPRDRGAGKTASTFATSVGTSVLTLEFQEFLPDMLRIAFHRHEQ